MKILLVHNKYKMRGGEDQVFESEEALLKSHGNEVDKLVFDNSEIKTNWDKFSTALGSVYNFQSGKIFKKKLAAFKPDIIHVHNFFPLASPSIFFIARRHGIPVVMTLHNYRLICPSATLFFDNDLYEKSIYKKFPIQAIKKGVYRDSKFETAMVVLTTGFHKLLHTWNKKITYYIALTNFAKNKFLNSSLKVDAEKIIVKPNFVEDFGFNIAHREKFFLFVGRLTQEKGVDLLITAAKQLPDVKFKIIGDGPLKEVVEKAANTNPNIEYLGFQKKEFIIEQLKKARALLFPSIWYEGFPMTILEAFSCGTPVIASDLGGPGEIIKNNVNGFLFNYKEKNDLILKIKTLKENDAGYEDLCKNARKDYLENYSSEKNYQMLVDIYKKSLG